MGVSLLVDGRVRDLLDALASPKPTPGGGSASALASAVGVSLLVMVASLPRTRRGTSEDRTALAASVGTLAPLRQELQAAIDADASSYELVMAAFRHPKGTAEEQLARDAAVQRALSAA